ncbi:MAG: TIR domain-containing protein, partial [Blastocatellia bacterium]
MPTEQNPPKVFISYSHDTREHRLRVYDLLKKLRADGVLCVTDHTMISPPEGWRAWMQDQIKEAHFTLVVCTETYCRRAERKEKPGVGLGATWEAALITDEIYRNTTRNERFIPVVFDKEDVAHIPSQLGQVSYYRVDLDDGYELLLRHLTNQPLFEETPVAEKMRELPPINRKIEPAKLKYDSNSLPSPTNATRVIRVVNAASQRGHQVNVSIELDAQGTENGFGFSLAFDAAQLGFINAMLGADAINATLNINKVQSSLGRVGLVVAFPTKQCVASGNNKKLVTLIFGVLASSTENKTALEFGDQPINREVVNLSAGDLPVTWTSGSVSIVSQQNVISQPNLQSLY